MTWHITIPHRHRDESLVDTASSCRHLPGDDAAAMRHLVFAAMTSGERTAGELLDRLDGMDPAERRALLDQARADAGLEPTAAVDARQPSVLTVRTVPASSDPMPFCAAVDCNQIPVRHGIPYTPDTRRWWCPAHEHLAQPGDLDPRGHGLTISPSGALVPDDPADDAREAERVESERRQREARHADRQVDAAEYTANRRARDEQSVAELPESVRRLVA